jgi:hypothetical protein
MTTGRESILIMSSTSSNNYCFMILEPDAKRLASLNDPFGAQLAAMKQGGGGGGGGGGYVGTFTFPVGLGITGSGKSCMVHKH